MPTNYDIGIYRISNLENSKVYIGSSINIKHRWSMHISDLKHNKHHSKHLQRAWHKYGSEVFKFDILQLCEKELLLYWEQKYIDKYKSANPSYGYNISSTAGNCLGIKHTKTARTNMSKAHFGIKMPPFTEKHKDSIRRAKLLSSKTPRIPVIALDPISKAIKYQFNSATQANQLGFDPATILKCCRGVRKTHKKLLWQFGGQENS